jgi:N-acetylneuraminic acid mutarotase
VILYGGSVDEETAAFQDTWAYDYDTDTWTQVSAASPIGPLAWHAMAATRNGILLFGGGVTRDDYVSGTWILDAIEGTWSRSE